MGGRDRAFRLEIRSTETRPSEETQQSVLPAMSQKFGQGVEISKATLEGQAPGTTTIGTVTTRNVEGLFSVYEYLEPNDLVKVGDIVSSDGSRVVTRRLHEADKDALDRREDAEVLGEAGSSVLVRVHSTETDDPR
ncbi:hypothetical protein [Halobacterium zhouii]|uniref:hypothetical protein n=1 Tax=Halobacterium zhouii TaxID=2902624 RepID=UPI001E344A8C|nr:hypothetical protein [Halobacterium zhouii]